MCGPRPIKTILTEASQVSLHQRQPPSQPRQARGKRSCNTRNTNREWQQESSSLRLGHTSPTGSTATRLSSPSRAPSQRAQTTATAAWVERTDTEPGMAPASYQSSMMHKTVTKSSSSAEHGPLASHCPKKNKRQRFPLFRRSSSQQRAIIISSASSSTTLSHQHSYTTPSTHEQLPPRPFPSQGRLNPNTSPRRSSKFETRETKILHRRNLHSTRIPSPCLSIHDDDPIRVD